MEVKQIEDLTQPAAFFFSTNSEEFYCIEEKNLQEHVIIMAISALCGQLQISLTTLMQTFCLISQPLQWVTDGKPDSLNGNSC